MLKKQLILVILFYFLALAQASFLAHFHFFDVIPNLILIAVVALAFLEKSKDYSGGLPALGGGFFLDVFSGNFLGFHVLILLAVYSFIKIIFKRYVGP
jgi:rod shape-determining protein MreD